MENSKVDLPQKIYRNEWGQCGQRKIHSVEKLFSSVLGTMFHSESFQQTENKYAG